MVRVRPLWGIDRLEKPTPLVFASLIFPTWPVLLALDLSIFCIIENYCIHLSIYSKPKNGF